MFCPKDKTELKQITKDDVVIDFCPTCRGVWLDRGELDKIIERSIQDFEESDAGKDKKSSVVNSMKTNEAAAYTQHKHRDAGEPSYLAGLFDLDTGSVNDRARYMRNDDLK